MPYTTAQRSKRQYKTGHYLNIICLQPQSDGCPFQQHNAQLPCAGRSTIHKQQQGGLTFPNEVQA